MFELPAVVLIAIEGKCIRVVIVQIHVMMMIYQDFLIVPKIISLNVSKSELESERQGERRREVEEMCVCVSEAERAKQSTIHLC